MVTYIWKTTIPILLTATFVGYVQLQPTGEVPAERMTAERLSFLEWFLSIVSLGSVTTEESNPEPIDPSKCEPCKCGLTNKRIRIVGGQETQVNQYPWMVQLLYNNRFYCGGSLINTKYILTASHCVKGFTRSRISVRLLDHARGTNDEADTIDRRVQHVLTHSRYNDNTFNNDIALLRLDREVVFRDRLRPVCLPPLGKSFSGMKGVVTGWGVTEPYGPPSDVLNEVTVPIISNDECRMTAYGKKKITDNMICAGFHEGKKDSCQGDSGGPLHVINGSVYSIAGECLLATITEFLD